MEMQMVNADKMRLDIGKTGRVVLYGIHFDHDKAVVKPESKPALDEIAKLLRATPPLKLIVVGHTDDAGSFDYNMDLSRRRAKAIVDAPIADYRIAQKRLRNEGIGYLAPAASNDTEEGRALNRRVELVKDRS
jgi:outer membrane protein OmpA-like peptidoglycan-associated protein